MVFSKMTGRYIGLSTILVAGALTFANSLKGPPLSDDQSAILINSQGCWSIDCFNCQPFRSIW
jgi:hypothetical protein